MSLSIFTSPSAMAANNALNRSNNTLSNAMERLGTGKRVNRAADDAAGLQIATRLQAQVNGMTVAQRNISDGIAMLQTAEGAFDEVTNVLHRMKDLSTQSANGTNSAKDHAAIQTEFTALGVELNNIMKNTNFGGENLFGETKFANPLSLQIGASAAETLVIDVGAQLSALTTQLGVLSGAVGAVDNGGSTVLATGIPANDKGTEASGTTTYSNGSKSTVANGVTTVTGAFGTTWVTGADGQTVVTHPSGKHTIEADGSVKYYSDNTLKDDKLEGIMHADGSLTDKDGKSLWDAVTGDGINIAASANKMITKVADAIDNVSALRSDFGATINRLGHTSSNLANMLDNTNIAKGNIMDADFAVEASKMTRNQMLTQTGMQMLKQSNSMAGMVTSLLG